MVTRERWALLGASGLAIGYVWACMPGALDETGKRCSDERPCGEGFVCAAGRCARGEGGGAPDASEDGGGEPLDSGYTPPDGGELVLVPRGSVWRYFDDGGFTASGWQLPGYSDGDWKAGAAPLGYDDKVPPAFAVATRVGYGPDAGNKHVTTYFRLAFDAGSGPAAYSGLTLSLRRDDGAVGYLNGSEVVRSNIALQVSVGPDTRASAHVSSPEDATFFDSAVAPGLLLPGTNVLAVEVHQDQPSSTDLVFDLELRARR